MNHRLTSLLAVLCCCSGAALAQTTPPSTPPSAPRTAAQRPDDRRSEQPVTIDAFGRPVELGLSYEFSAERRSNFDLRATEENGRRVLDHELKLDAGLQLNDSVSLFVQAVVLADRRTELSNGSVERNESIERGQAWALVDRVGGLPLSVQLGRVALIERRSWWWDDDLDAVRVIYMPGDWRIETGLAREVARVSSTAGGIDPTAKNVTRWFGNAAWRWAERHSAEAFWLLADDRSGAPAPGSSFVSDSEDPLDGRLRWFGLRASGEVRFESKHRFTYRADAAIVRGHETNTPFTETDSGALIAGSSNSYRVRGHAWDLGAQWVLPGDLRPTFSLGWAAGSGGTDGVLDRNFRQTGLQENKGRMGGVKRLRYYGELLRPDLANLRISTAGFGLRFLANSSAEVLWHGYRQREASTTLAGARLSEDPAGIARDIGDEIDLFIAMREWQHVELTLTLSRFRPGAAFADDKRDAAYGIELGVAVDF
jgi:alginate production protein